MYHSVEHEDVHVVAVNDPFIEPKYAVSVNPPSAAPLLGACTPRPHPLTRFLPLGLHAEV